MTRVEHLESEISKLSEEERRELEQWFLEQQADTWDRQIEEDAKTDRLDHLAKQALRDYEEGRCTDL